MLDLSVIILTKNEEIHIERCLSNIHDIAKEIFIIDSYSTDSTLEIARKFPKAQILQNKWENSHAKQFNWGLENAPITGKWILRLDADEYLSNELIEELILRLPHLPDDISGIVLPLRRVFLGRTIRRGMKQIKLLRIFRSGCGRSEIRQMDEHIQLLKGTTIEFENEFSDDNLNNLSWWTQKHIGYAIREAADLLDIEFNLTNSQDVSTLISAQASNKRAMKHKYAKQPLFLRSFAYFCYRYFLKLGFLEGKEGFLWHFLQGWWYRTLVDAKVFEIKKACGNDPHAIKEHLREHYHIHI